MCGVVEGMNNSVLTVEDEPVISWKGEGHATSRPAVGILLRIWLHRNRTPQAFVNKAFLKRDEI